MSLRMIFNRIRFMGVQRLRNFAKMSRVRKTTDSSLTSSSLNIDANLRDSTVPQSPGGLSRTGHTVVAICLGFILVAGILTNHSNERRCG
ncbi:hypothetical protein PAMA_017188 [Pampus argenteus]